MNNIPIKADELKETIEKFLETECGGDDVNDKEEKMYKQLRIARDCIEEFTATQQMTNRKFEVGKAYYDKWYNLRIVEKRLESGNLRFKGSYGISYVFTDTDGNERVSGTYIVRA